MKTLLPALLAFVLAASCGGSEGSPAPGGTDSDAAGLWVLESGRAPSGEVVAVDGYPVKLELIDEAAGGTAGCNSYRGDLEIDGSSFDTGEISVTEIACPPKVAAAEERYLEALEAADSIAVDGDSLTLTGPDVELVYSRVPPVETESLVDTTWMLHGLIEGGRPGGSVSSARPARLRLDSDGTYEGSTGCRDFSGEWTEAGDRVVFPIMEFEGRCEPRGVTQDNHVITVLATGVTVSVEGDELTLMSARGGVGLVYRAQ
ncbi:MAG TPA: META domain-containing protein [Actinomycetota bacterium]|nr:META domain-containing protein [Actinomycetota bacterium]